MNDRDNQDWNRILNRLGIATSGEKEPVEPVVRLGLPPVENPPLERRYANEERWDWWKEKAE